MFVIRELGFYLIFIRKVFTNLGSWRIYKRQILDDCVLIGINSIFLISFVSIFIGSVTVVQTAYHLVSPLIPRYIIALVSRDMIVLEISPTIIGIVFAGKIGSSIAGNIGSMRITDQIDALEVMGINSSSYLLLPKIIAAVLTFPLLVSISMFMGISAGYIAGVYSNLITSEEFRLGLRNGF